MRHKSDMTNFWQNDFAAIRSKIKERVRDARVLRIQVAGSHSHNLDMPGSDVDYMAVYAIPLRQMIGVLPATETMGSCEGEKPDWTAHCVTKFAKLLISGNPGMLDLGTATCMCESSPIWAVLQQNIRTFVSQHAVMRHIGYLNSQMMRLRKGMALHTTGGNYNTKWAMHAVRLAMDAAALSVGKLPNRWKTGLERTKLKEIRRGDWTVERVEEFVNDMCAVVEGNRPWPWPDLAQHETANAWLRKVYEKERC